MERNVAKRFVSSADLIHLWTSVDSYSKCLCLHVSQVLLLEFVFVLVIKFVNHNELVLIYM